MSMEPRGSLSHSQGPYNNPYRDLIQSLVLAPNSLKIRSKIVLSSMPRPS